MSVEPIQFEVIEHLSAAQLLEPEWSELWERCSCASAFQSPAWVLGSWRQFYTWQPRAMLTARCRKQLVAVLALRLSPEELTLEGSEVSDYLDVLVDPSFSSELATPLLSSVLEITGERTLRMERQTARSPLLAMQWPAGYPPKRSEQDVCPYVTVPKFAPGLGSVIPKGFLKRVEQTRRAADRHFRVELSVASTVAAGEYLERLFKLHTARWSERRQTGVFADSATRRFYLDAVPRLVARDQAWLLELMFDGTPVASLLALHGHERVHYYVGGFDSRYATFSPGRLLIAALFERAVAQGYEEVDFLRGVERYKYDWGALNRSTCCITIEPLERRACATG